MENVQLPPTLSTTASEEQERFDLALQRILQTRQTPSSSTGVVARSSRCQSARSPRNRAGGEANRQAPQDRPASTSAAIRTRSAGPVLGRGLRNLRLSQWRSRSVRSRVSPLESSSTESPRGSGRSDMNVRRTASEEKPGRSSLADEPSDQRPGSGGLPAPQTFPIVPILQVEGEGIPRTPSTSAPSPVRGSSLSRPEDSVEDLSRRSESEVVTNLRRLLNAFSRRTQTIKEQLEKEVKEDHPDIDPKLGAEGKPRKGIFEDLPSAATTVLEDDWMETMGINTVGDLKKSAITDLVYKVRHCELGSFEPQSSIYVSWLAIVSLTFLYNAWMIFLRGVFGIGMSPASPWFVALFVVDYICDAVYLVDIWFKMRLKFVRDGDWVESPEEMRHHYFKRDVFKMDLIALLPLDLLYLWIGINHPAGPFLRLLRLAKVNTFWEFFNRMDAIARSPYMIRILRMLVYLLYLMHLTACAYYAMSKWERDTGMARDPQKNQWVYWGEGNAYLRCIYFAIRTAFSISGRNPKPQNEYEKMFMAANWLMGVFVFALLIGQIRDIVATATKQRTQYRQVMDQTIRYMTNLSLPADLQRRVRLWLNHTWDLQKCFNESPILNVLPSKIQTDLALSVHYRTLSKVQLFKECERTVLRDLVLKLRPVLFLPGDYICYKGEIGQQMFIVNSGYVQVMSPRDEETVLATLSEGSVFGEVSVLGIPGLSRRTADVRSVGFSQLFALSKVDLWDTLQHYPEAQTVMRMKARSLMKSQRGTTGGSGDDDEDLAEGIIPAEEVIKATSPERPTTPKLVHAVVQAVLSGAGSLADGGRGRKLSESQIPEILYRSRSSSIRSSFSIAPTVSPASLLSDYFPPGSGSRSTAPSPHEQPFGAFLGAGNSFSSFSTYNETGPSSSERHE